jgi:hypothetical protein
MPTFPFTFTTAAAAASVSVDLPTLRSQTTYVPPVSVSEASSFTSRLP